MGKNLIILDNIYFRPCMQYKYAHTETHTFRQTRIQFEPTNSDINAPYFVYVTHTYLLVIIQIHCDNLISNQNSKSFAFIPIFSHSYTHGNKQTHRYFCMLACVSLKITIEYYRILCNIICYNAQE